MQMIPRSSLSLLLDKGLQYPLVLIVAAPGSGKTSLLDQWHQGACNADSKRKFIRFDAAKKFNEGDRLFEEIFKHIRNITPLWEASFFKLFQSDQESDKDTLIDIFIHGFCQIKHPIAIVIDDFHLIKNARTLDIFNGLINRLPKHISFVLASRTHPNLSISKFKLEERIFVIDSNDLKLKPEELSSLNQIICHSNLDQSQLSELLELTEGWFVGIKLALIAYAEGGNKALENFSGTQPELLNYFAHEVVSKLPLSIRKTILNASICSSFNQVLCDALDENQMGSASLEALIQHELFIRSDNEEAGWYRFHPLLQSFLYQRLEIEKGKETIRKLHIKAAKCLLNLNKTSQAIYHAQQSLDATFYIEMLLSASNMWIKIGEFEPIIDALSELTEQDLRQHTQLHINLIYALTFSRRFNQASYQLDRLNHEIKSASEVDTTRFLRFLLELFQSDSEIQNLSLPKNRITQDTPKDVVGMYLIIEAYNNMYNGLLTDAFCLATKAKHLLSAIKHDFFLSYANLILILCDRYLGRGIEAIELMLSLFNPIKHGPKTPIWINISAGMIVVDYEQNRLEEALALGEQLIPLSSHSSITEVIVNAYLYSARINHIFGKKNKAKRLLDQLERILSLGDYERFNSQIIHEKMRQAIQEKTGNAAEQLFKRYHLVNVVQNGVWSKASACYEEHRERLALACAYGLIAKRQFDSASEILHEIAIILDKQNLPLRALIARCNLAMIHFRQDKKEAASRQLKRLIERYGLVCFSRTVFDETPNLENLFKYAISETIVEVPTLFTDIFSSLFPKQASNIELIAPAQGLTEKEGEIFELLSSGLSNAAISQQSGIALSTTKWHLKNIYQKLGVENRSAALMMAHKQTSTT